MLKAAKYPATLTGHGLQEDKDGNAAPYMTFTVKDFNEANEEEEYTVYWTGSLKSEKSQELAVKALVTAGFQGNDWADVPNPMMYVPKDIAVVLEEMKDSNEKGTGKFRVQWVNSAKKQFSGAVPSSTAVFAKVKSTMGIKTDAGFGF